MSMTLMYLLSFGRCDLEREARPPREIYIVVKNTPKVDEIVNIICFNSVAYLFLYIIHTIR